ncbi:MAG: BspA family leucine-rich repeat surface protein [Clostridia bacterium]|nr:BspA family leucine-rich repeat surface protein [Clostridia bacterium]
MKNRKMITFGAVLSLLFCFLCIGYAQLSDTLSVEGNVGATAQEDVFIYEVSLKSGNSAEEIRMSGTTLTCTLTPGETATYYVSFINRNPTYDYYYAGLLTDETGELTGNISVTENTSLPDGQIIESGGRLKRYTLTLQASAEAEESLTSVVEFKFACRNAVMAGGNTWYNTDYDKSEINIIEIKKTTDKVEVVSSTEIKRNGVSQTVLAAWYPSQSSTHNLIAYVAKDSSGYVVLYLEGGDEEGEIFLDNADYTFSGFTGLNEVEYPLHYFLDLNVSQCTSMIGTFSGSMMKNADLTGWDTGRVTSMRDMFNGCTAMTRLHVADFDTSAVTDFSGMFQDCSALRITYNYAVQSDGTTSYKWHNRVDLSHFDFSKAETTAAMFSGCLALTQLDLSMQNADGSTVLQERGPSDMSDMFRNCEELDILDIRGLNTRYATDMSYLLAVDGSTSNILYIYYIWGGSESENPYTGWNMAAEDPVTGVTRNTDNITSGRTMYDSDWVGGDTEPNWSAWQET